jgi:predicted RNase H-like HicB family nuclease
MKQKVKLTRDENGWIVAEVPELPGCVSQGRTEAEALANIEEAIAVWRLAEKLKRVERPSDKHAL